MLGKLSVLAKVQHVDVFYWYYVVSDYSFSSMLAKEDECGGPEERNPDILS